MVRRRFVSWVLFVAAAGLALAGCEPYMSMTDRVPAQTRTAMALLPDAPRYAGMVDLETVMGQLDTFSDVSLADSLRQADNERLRAFMDATGLDPETDLKAVYGAVGGDAAPHVVVFADLSPKQMDRYLDRAPSGSGRATTYRNVPVYHLRIGPGRGEDEASLDTLSLAFVENGTIAASTDAGAVQTMVDRFRAGTGGLRGNASYATLIEKVGHGSTAWLVGRDVLQTALRDSATDRNGAVPKTTSRSLTMSSAGVQRLLSSWADRVLGMSEGGAPAALDGSTGSRVKELQSRIREQAVSLTLTDAALDGKVYLTMRDAASASNVVDLSKGVLAAVRLSEQEIDGLKGDLLDDVTIERTGPVVHVQFAVDRDLLRREMGAIQDGHAARRSIPSIHRVKVPIRRWGGITTGPHGVRAVRHRDEACNLSADPPVPPGVGEGPDPAPHRG